MFNRFTSYVRVLIRREHWWAEIWSGLILMSFGLFSLLLPVHHLAEMSATVSLMRLVPNGLWQSGMVICGLCQVVALSIDRPLLRVNGALFSLVFYGWITFSILIYGYGQQPTFVFPAGWMVVNFYAVRRAIGGLR